MNLKAKSALFAMLFMCIAAFAQEKLTVKGVVVDAEYNMPLPNVNVIIVGTNTGASRCNWLWYSKEKPFNGFNI